MFTYWYVKNFFNILYLYILIYWLEYGGNDGTIQDIIDYWSERLSKQQPFFDEEEKYGTNESKRKGASLYNESLFGIDGSFRKLNVD